MRIAKAKTSNRNINQFQSITLFQSKVYALVKKIPRGKVTSYSAIAKKLHSSPRAVGQALRVNPFAPQVPCHRVIRSDGTIGGFRGETCGKAIKEKIEMLRKEGVLIKKDSSKKYVSI